VVAWQPRLIEPDELQATIDLSAVAYGTGPRAPDDFRKRVSLISEPDRTFVVEDGDAIAGTAATYSLALALPGGASLPLAGVTWVGVSPIYRRRGVLRALIEAVHDQARDRSEPIAGLTASEGGIYRRFGYGVAARSHAISVDRARAAEVDAVFAVGAGAVGGGAGGPGRIRLISEAEANLVLPMVFDRYWIRVPGEVRRPARWWDMMALDAERGHDGASARFVAVHDDAQGAPDGVAIYRIKQGWGSEATLPHELRIESIAAADDAVEAALLRFVLDVDLVAAVEWAAAPVDLPLRWRLSNPRAVRVTAERDHLWLRPFDVAACLSARRYAVDGGCVIEVVDRPGGDVGERLRLDGGPDGADCAATDADPGLVVGIADLGARCWAASRGPRWPAPRWSTSERRELSAGPTRCSDPTAPPTARPTSEVQPPDTAGMMATSSPAGRGVSCSARSRMLSSPRNMLTCRRSRRCSSRTRRSRSGCVRARLSSNARTVGASPRAARSTSTPGLPPVYGRRLAGTRTWTAGPGAPAGVTAAVRRARRARRGGGARSTSTTPPRHGWRTPRRSGCRGRPRPGRRRRHTGRRAAR
jgi:predicted acetyltransferase